jgi:TetR/AcrR family transcriptional regulator
MAAVRRIGAQDSKTRAQLLDAAERLMLDEGYAGVTSRRVASRAGLKPQLVHYYFRTMDDLFLEVFRRRADEGLERFAKAVAENRSLRTLWEYSSQPPGAAFTIEFVVLANHRKAIRAEIAHYAERFRKMQLDAIEALLADHGLPADTYPPIVVLLALTGLTQVMALEDTLGVTAGHAETMAYVEQVIAKLEGDLRATADRSPEP